MKSTRGRTHQYEARTVWTGSGERGTADYAAYERSYDILIEGKPELRGTADSTFRGDPAVHNPEDLFLAALSACHMLSYLALCAVKGVRVMAYEDRATALLALDPGGGGRFTEVQLAPAVVIADPESESLALALHDDAHHQCFLASSCSVPVRCRPTVRAAEGAAVD